MVPFDGSEGATRALAFAIKHAKERPGALLRVLTVHPPPEVYGKVEMYLDRRRVREWMVRRDAGLLRRAEKRLRRARVPYELEALEGDPAEVIAGRAKALKCGSIIMGTRGLGRVATLVLGSVATKVIHLSSVPVTLVK
jgi:nucleotide-binding universal stress UspA family protein